MHRPTVGIIALVLIAIGGAGQLWPLSGGQSQPWTIACLRVGMVMGVLWLALPQTRTLKNPIWLVTLFVAALVVALRPKLILVALQPKLILAALIALILIAILRPRRASKSATRAAKRRPKSKASPPGSPR